MADITLLGLFPEVTPASDVVEQLRQKGIPDDKVTVISGIPYKAEMLGRPGFHGRVSCGSLSGASLGVLTAAFLTAGIFLLYPLVQGGQPIVPIPPSLIVFFEVTMLGTMWSAFFGFLWLNKLPVFKPQAYDPHITEGYIGVEVVVDEADIDQIEDIFKSSNAEYLRREKPELSVDVGFRRFWASVAIAILVVGVVSTLFFYDVFRIPFPSNMVDQDSIAFDQGPRLAAPVDAVPVQGPVLIAGQPASEPIPSSPASLQRGQVLFNINCVVCHGAQGQGNGTVGTFFNPRPANLTSTAIQDLSDDQIFLVITQGFGPMPSIAENLSPAERWDVINHVRSLKK
jgi:mono/diheme cytochrome c family protein